MTSAVLDRSLWLRLLRFAGGYWFVYLVLNCILWSLAGVDLFESLPGKLALITACVIMALGIAVVLKKADDQPVSYQASLSLGLSIVASILFVVVDHINLLIYLYPETLTLDPTYIGLSLIEGVAIFFGWCCLWMMFLSGVRQQKTVDASVPGLQVTDLTGRQREILDLLLQDKSNKEIARELNISPLTVRNHISVLFRQFGVKRRKDLASVIAVQNSGLSA
jgi:DNA-binding CsgD family transcriptional regulator